LTFGILAVLKGLYLWLRNARGKSLGSSNEGRFPLKNGRGDLLRENPAFSNKGLFRRLNVV
jgi:hypothetical protein